MKISLGSERWLAVGLMLLLAGSANAQISGSGGFGGSSGSGVGGSGGFSGSGGGFSGSSGGSGGSGGFSGSGGSFTGSSGGFSGSGGSFSGSSGGVNRAGSFLPGPGGSRGQTYGSTTAMGRYYGNPLAIGLANPTSNSAANQYLRAYPVQLAFGTPLYGNIPTTNIGGTLGTASLAASSFRGATSFGVRRAPAYTAELAFEHTPRSTEEVRTDLQEVLARSSRLSSRDNIRVVMRDGAVVLRGQARNDHERRLAEALVRLTPGVREVRNEIVIPGD